MIVAAVLLVTLPAVPMAQECSGTHGEFLVWNVSGVQKRREFITTLVNNCKDYASKHQNHPLVYKCEYENKAKEKQEGTGKKYDYLVYFSEFVSSIHGDPRFLAKDLFDRCPNKRGMCENVQNSKGIGCSKKNGVSMGFTWVLCMIDPTRHGEHPGFANMCEYRN